MRGACRGLELLRVGEGGGGVSVRRELCEC